MRKYTIYCTEEQTKKALELGAPLNTWGFARELVIPTAEQMINWLEEYDLGLRFKIIRDKYANWTCSVYKSYEFSEYKSYFTSRKEATLAAIDAALDYLIKYKK